MRLFRVIREISRVAALTRGLPEKERREAIVGAVRKEEMKRSEVFSLENYGRKGVREEMPEGIDLLPVDLGLLESTVRAMLKKYGPGRRTLTVPLYQHDDDAAEVLERLGFEMGDAPRLRAVEKDVADRSTVTRKRARAVSSVLSL